MCQIMQSLATCVNALEALLLIYVVKYRAIDLTVHSVHDGSVALSVNNRSCSAVCMSLCDMPSVCIFS